MIADREVRCAKISGFWVGGTRKRMADVLISYASEDRERLWRDTDSPSASRWRGFHWLATNTAVEEKGSRSQFLPILDARIVHPQGRLTAARMLAIL
jgi:hypothetical protein